MHADCSFHYFLPYSILYLVKWMLSAVVDVYFCRKVMSLSQISGQILKGKQEVSLQAGLDKITASSGGRF